LFFIIKRGLSPKFKKVKDKALKVNSLLQKELNQIFLKDIEFPQGLLVTITRVETSDDLYHARIYISVLPENGEERVLRILDKLIYPIQQKINHRLRMRPIPQIRFVKETETFEAGKIEGLLYDIKKNEH